MKIVFRTSGGRIPKRELGLGHIYRCINLSKELTSHKITFLIEDCLLYTSPSPRDATLSRMPSSA